MVSKNLKSIKSIQLLSIIIYTDMIGPVACLQLHSVKIECRNSYLPRKYYDITPCAIIFVQGHPVWTKYVLWCIVHPRTTRCMSCSNR